MSVSLPRVLFLAPVEPWSRENGSSLIIADLVEALARQPDLDVLPVFMRRPPPGYTSRPPARFEGVTLGVEGRPKWASVVTALLRGASPLDTRFANKRVGDLVLRAMQAEKFAPDVVHVEHLPLLPMGRRIAREYATPLVYRAHNVESELWARRLGSGALGRRVGRRMGHLEARAMERCDLTLCISSVDLAWARANAPSAPATLFPCSLLVDRYDAIEARYPSDEPQMCFVGGLEWGPNEVGLEWFVRDVLPAIVAQVPDVRLAVLARGAADRAWLASNPAVRILPQEADARSLFASSRVSIAPLLQGGGVRIKIPESLAVGCPVVATPIGGEGLELPGLSITVDPAAFAAACVEQLGRKPGPELRRTLRAAVETHHGADGLARRLVDYWRELHQRAGRRRSESLAASS